MSVRASSASPNSCSGAMYGSEPTTMPACGHSPVGFAAGEEHGEPEVENLRLAVGGEHDVARLQVAMQEPVPVRIVERVGDRRAEPSTSSSGSGPALEARLERAAGARTP